MAFFRFLAAARRSLPRLLPLFRHAGVPFWLKAGAVALAVLIVSPIDLFGDIPGLGLLDDAVLLALLLNGFVALASRFAYASTGRFADAPMRRVNPVLSRLHS